MTAKRVLAGLFTVCICAAPLRAQQPAARPNFLIADVHESPHRHSPFANGGELHGDRYLIHQSTLVDMIVRAYDVDAEMVQGGPAWLELKRFEIIAKAAPTTSPADLKRMLQSLLADRFHLVMHKGEVQTPAWILTAPDGKSKLHPAEKSEGHMDCEPPAVPETAGGIPLNALTCTGMTGDDIAQMLHSAAGNYLSQRVVSRTGFDDRWDFTIKWTDPAQLTRAEADGISLFRAIEELGLKLELKTAPQTVWIVDSVNETPTPNAPEVAKAFPASPPAHFEVATIKPSRPDEPRWGRWLNGQWTVNALSLKSIISYAWDLNESDNNLFVNAPSWLESAKFDFVAKLPPPEPITGRRQQLDFDDEEFRQMLQALLIERFKMQVHTEVRPIDAYKLVADHPRLKEADPKSRTRCKEGPGVDGKDPRQSNPMMNRLMTCNNMTPKQMGEAFAYYAEGYIYSTVGDETGLKGSYDFTLNWSSLNQNPLKPPPPTGAPQQTPEFDGTVTFYDAVEKQLGLKLVKEKRPLPVLVIDHIEPKPIEN